MLPYAAHDIESVSMLTVWQVLPWHKCVFRIKGLVRVLKNIVPIFFIDKISCLSKKNTIFAVSIITTKSQMEMTRYRINIEDLIARFGLDELGFCKSCDEVKTKHLERLKSCIYILPLLLA